MIQKIELDISHSVNPGPIIDDIITKKKMNSATQIFHQHFLKRVILWHLS